MQEPEIHLAYDKQRSPTGPTKQKKVPSSFNVSGGQF